MRVENLGCYFDRSSRGAGSQRRHCCYRGVVRVNGVKFRRRFKTRKAALEWCRAETRYKAADLI